ncbi:MAG: SDR family oxidoreductase [Bacteroidetes bacterium]|nr:SDR family oxidoreductase [Bacteroidota bacterium]
MDLNGKVAIVTGANKGIGLACSRLLLQNGAIVYGICRSEFHSDHADFRIKHADVGDIGAVNEVVKEILKNHSTVDILINNAGLGYFGFCDELEPEKWQEMFATNIHAIFYFSRLVLPGMKQKSTGHIINIASTAGLEGYVQTSGYCATKFAVRGFSDALYKEVRDYGVKVTCVYPGSVKTDFFRHHSGISPHDYMLKAEDVAQHILYALQSPPNFHTVNLEIRPLQPKGPRNKD